MRMVLYFVFPALLSAGVIGVMLRSGRVGAVDVPNARSLHSRAVPRSGGLGILAGLAVGLFGAGMGALAALVVLLAAVSWWDDRRNLPPWIRLAAHLFCAAALLVTGGVPGWGLLAALVMVLGLAWLINLYNFMDGADGLAGGMSVVGFGALGLAAQAAGGAALASLTFAAAGAALGFLFFNFHPARIFMGDVGSIPLGFLAGAAGLLGVGAGYWPLPFVLLVFSPFIVDATLTLVRRALRGERVWEAHREHFYQRLIQSGWSHRRTALAAYVLMLATAASALALRSASSAAWGVALALWGVIYAAGAVWIDRRWQRHLQESGT